ncbi:hypothetical protein [Fulvivirga lutea]|uniref:Thiamine pyrophosphokinase n=1 Tax=Fulvivirga lutea TaxID=2810512 RepID=A0A975A1G7_9BACT|nr:hypothetical protein [Fulvivirga lutea]QSE98424.1 hypothetical protein JR347_04935 [Fulvivirga lutea]
MSSHHIVRDEQEPALLLLNQDYSTDLLGNLLEWSPTVIIDSEIANAVGNGGFKVDIVIGTEKKLVEAKGFLQAQEPVKYLSKNESDDSFLQALYYLSAANYKAINVLADINDKYVNESQPFLPKLTIVFYGDGYKWYFVKDATFKKWLKAGQKIKLFDTGLLTDYKNLKENKSELIVVQDGQAELSVTTPGFWLGETI